MEGPGAWSTLSGRWGDRFRPQRPEGGCSTRSGFPSFRGATVSHSSGRSVMYLRDARQDLFHAARGLLRQPGFTLFVVLTLGLGIGANSSIFGLLDRLLLSPPPHIRDAGRVVRLLVGERGGDSRFTRSTTSYPVFMDLHNTRSFESLAAASTGPIILGRGVDATALHGGRVTGGYFNLLGVRPEVGRFFGEEEDLPPRGLQVAVLSHAFWQSRFGGDPNALGKEIVLNGGPFTILGVAPRGFTGDGVSPIDVWVPFSVGGGLPPGWREERDFNLVAVLARLKLGVSPAAARQEATGAYLRGLESIHPENAARGEINFLSLIAARGQDGPTQEGRIALWLGGVALAVFLIAVGNVTNLLLLRTARRQSEITVRLALGMSPGRLARLWLTESLLLSVLGGAVGLLVASWGGNLARLVLLPDMAPTETFFGVRVFLVTAVAAIVAGLIAGFLPARQAASSSLAHRLNPGAQARSVRRSVPLTMLLLLQTGLSAVLLAGAGLFVSSLYNVRTQHLGFTTQHVLLASVPADDASSAGGNQDAFFRQALEQVKRLPGVEMAIPIDSLPFGAHSIPPISVPGLEGAPGQNTQLPFMNAATPEYFKMTGMTIRRGRGFAAMDNGRAPLVVIVSETMARTIWPHEDAIGKCIRIGHAEGEEPSMQASPSLPCRDIVGIANDARGRSIRPEAIPIMQYYVPYEQLPRPPFPGIPTISGILVRTSGEPQKLARAVQQAIQSVGSHPPYVDVRPYQDLIDPQIRPWRLGATLFSVFGGLALTMSAIGLYGVLAFMVAQRRKEIGIKMALGASAGHVVRGIVREGLCFALAGLGIGGLMLLGMGRWLEPLLFGVTPRDPAVLGTVALTLAGVAVLASVIPALRVTRVDPNLALRTE
jgi:putative ABC transport system permease protein